MTDRLNETPVGTIQALGTDDYTATIPANRALGVPLLVAFEHANTRAVTLNKKPVRTRTGAKTFDLAVGALDPNVVYELDDAGGQYLLGASTDSAIREANEPARWQVKFKSGQGQQVRGGSADEVRALMAKHYGEDYAIESITELK